jgi:hypothetical protein
VPKAVAESTALLSTATLRVVTVNGALYCPAAITTDVGTVALRLVDANATVAPPAGAGLPSITTPLTDDPPVTL